MPKGQASAERQVQSIIEFTKVIEMYQGKIDKLQVQVLEIHQLIEELNKDYQGKSENQYIIQKLQKITGTWNQ